MVAGLLEEISLNHVENPAMRRRMQGLADELTRLDTGELSAAERDLTRVVKGSRCNGRQAARQVWRNAGRSGLEIKSSGDGSGADADHGQWNSFRGLARELTQIRRELTELTQATKDLGSHTLTQDFRELTAQQQADLKKLSSRQLDQARDFDRLEQRLEPYQTDCVRVIRWLPARWPMRCMSRDDKAPAACCAMPASRSARIELARH